MNTLKKNLEEQEKERTKIRKLRRTLAKLKKEEQEILKSRPQPKAVYGLSDPRLANLDKK